MFETYEDVMTVYDVAEALMVGKNRIYEMLESGEIEGIRLKHIWRIPKQNLINYITKGRYKGTNSQER